MTHYAIPGFHIHDHRFSVPLNWADPSGAQIAVFAREVTAAGRDSRNLPVLLYLQGGPGGKSPRPVEGGPGWLAVATQRFRVLLLDQRGTGRSHPVQAHHMAGLTAEEGARYLAHFRADSIVRDAEHIRRTLLGDDKWYTLGQSYGGFLTLSYLSHAPEGLAGCYITGGLPGIHADAEEVYRRTFRRVADKNAQYFRRYPQDRALLDQLADVLAARDVRLADGDRLTVQRLQSLGHGLGMSDGFETVHWLLDEAFCADGQLADGFLDAIGKATSFAQRPLFAAIHEPIYSQNGARSDWAAARVQADLPQFAPTARPLLFTGEMIFPWMFAEMQALHPFAAAAEALARMPLAPALYDPLRLAANEVPLAAAIYTDDMYVDLDLSLQTARSIGSTRVWLTNEYEHNGLRASPRVLERLLGMADAQEGFNFMVL